MFVFVFVLFDVANDEVAKEDPGPLLGGENTCTLGRKVSRDSSLAGASFHIVRRHPWGGRHTWDGHANTHCHCGKGIPNFHLFNPR